MLGLTLIHVIKSATGGMLHLPHWGTYSSPFSSYRQTYDISRTKPQNLNVSRLALQLAVVFVQSIEARC